MTLSQKTGEIISRLEPVYDRREAKNILEMAIEHIKGWSRVDILLNGDKEISDYFSSKLDEVTDRLLRHEPIQYILGEAYWHGLTIKVTPGVLIPRPETSQLVDLIVDENSGSDLKVLDLCTGSGAIALALARSLKFPQVTAVDISDKALGIADENDRNLHTGIRFLKADVLRKLPFPSGSFDLITANPPYVCEKEREEMDRNVLDYEPAEALFVPDDDPLRFYKTISPEGYRVAADGGKIYLELNPDYAQAVCRLMEKDGWEEVTIINDMFGRARFARAIKQGI